MVHGCIDHFVFFLGKHRLLHPFEGPNVVFANGMASMYYTFVIPWQHISIACLWRFSDMRDEYDYMMNYGVLYFGFSSVNMHHVRVSKGTAEYMNSCQRTQIWAL